MTDPEITRMLSEPLRERFELPMNVLEEQILQAITVGGAILPGHAERYRTLRRELEAEGSSDELRAQSLDAAGDLAAVLRQARRHQPSLVALEGTALKTAALFGALEQVYDSFVLLTDPEPDEAALTEDELDDLLAMPGLQEYLHP